MSRCFPFHPKGYTRNGSCSEALIESIKLRREDEKAKKDHKKEKRRDKKEKRRKEKEEKRKERKGTISQSSDVTELKHIEPEKIRADKSSGCLQKRDDYDNEQLERSDTTVEHNHPVSWLEPCCSDSIQSGSKRKRSASPSSHNSGNGIRIRFSLTKHRDPEEYKPDERLGSTSGRAGTADSSTDGTKGNQSHHQLHCVENADTVQPAGNFDSRHSEKLQNTRNGAASNTKSLDGESQRVVTAYNSLFQNWVPPPLTFDGVLSEDQDWLFGSELQEVRPVSKRIKPVSSALLCSSSSLWPRAQYLPEVEIYALPYTVPY